MEIDSRKIERDKYKHKDKHSMRAWTLTRDFRNRNIRNVSGTRVCF